jgi:hypothetical protein
MRRREFVTLLGGAPIEVRAQPALLVIGFLSSRSPGESARLVAAFRRGLNQLADHGATRLQVYRRGGQL